MANWLGWIVDVKGAFLHGRFENNEKIFMKIPDGFQKHYPTHVVLQLIQTLYGLVQAAMQFWREVQAAMRVLTMARNCVNPCLFYKWIEGHLVLVLVWIDDFALFGPDHLIPPIKEELIKVF